MPTSRAYARYVGVVKIDACRLVHVALPGLTQNSKVEA